MVAETVNIEWHVALDDIDDGERMRPIDAAYAEAIAASFMKIGQLTAIDICQLPNLGSGRPFKLVYGGHRLAAARMCGWSTIRVKIGSNEVAARKDREIHENFFRNELSPIDKAIFVAEMLQAERVARGIADGKDGRALNGDYRSQKFDKKQIDNDVRNLRESFGGLQEVVAARLGWNRQEVGRQLALAAIKPSYVEKLRQSAIANNASQLRAFAKLDDDRQFLCAGQLKAGKATTVAGALAIVDKKAVEPKEVKQVASAHSMFSRLSPAQKAEFLRLIQPDLPKGWEVREVKPRETYPTVSDVVAAAKKVGDQ
ncbi:hypothetical protein AEYBE204_13040 [Asticcacaulis sp. YBE204]|nr:hypothetical protein AEYBE204_13040 [Asticcacaulis sp. YBE204]